MTLVEHAKRELDLLQSEADSDEPGGGDDFQRAINEHLLSMVALFAEEGHSGGSASYSIGMLQRLLSYEPITPLTGADGEWMEVADGMEQNTRCSRVFREKGIAYDIDAVVFREWRGDGSFTGWDSARRVKFPYFPKTRYTRFRRLSRLWGQLRGQMRPK